MFINCNKLLVLGLSSLNLLGLNVAQVQAEDPFVYPASGCVSRSGGPVVPQFDGSVRNYRSSRMYVVCPTSFDHAGRIDNANFRADDRSNNDSVRCSMRSAYLNFGGFMQIRSLTRSTVNVGVQTRYFTAMSPINSSAHTVLDCRIPARDGFAYSRLATYTVNP